MILAIADLSRIIIIAEVICGAYLLFLFPGSRFRCEWLGLVWKQFSSEFSHGILKYLRPVNSSWFSINCLKIDGAENSSTNQLWLVGLLIFLKDNLAFVHVKGDLDLGDFP